MNNKQIEIRDKLIQDAENNFSNVDGKAVVSRILDYKNDAFFKYVLTHSSRIRNVMCQYILGEDIHLKETYIVDTHLYKQFLDDKYSILDISANDDLGNSYNIEMYYYGLDHLEFKRFQSYAFKTIVNSLKETMKFSELKPVYQLIINGTGKDAENLDGFEHHFGLYDDIHHEEFPDSLYHTCYIQLHHMNKSDHLSAFLQIMYMFKTNGSNDIIDSEVVREMRKMHATYTEDEARMTAALQEEISRMYYDVRLDNSMKKGIEASIVKNLKSLMESLNCDLEYAMDLLKITEKDKYRNLIK